MHPTLILTKAPVGEQYVKSRVGISVQQYNWCILGFNPYCSGIVFLLINVAVDESLLF
jgi:hypothetical protein